MRLRHVIRAALVALAAAVPLASPGLATATPAVTVSGSASTSGLNADTFQWETISAGWHFLSIGADSTETCRRLEIEWLEAPGPMPALWVVNEKHGYWRITVPPAPVGSDTYRFKAVCTYALIATAESGEKRLTVPRYVAPPTPTDAGTRAGGTKGGKGAKNGAATSGARTRAAIVTGVDLIDQVAARESLSALPLRALAAVPLPLGRYQDAVVVEEPPAIGTLPAALGTAGATAVRAVLANLDQQRVLGRAAVEALARSYAADDAGDAAATRRQAVAAADLLERWAGALGDAASLRPAAQAAIAGLGLPAVTLTTEQAASIAALAQTGTPPAGIAAALADAGASPAEVEEIGAQLARLTASAVQSYTPTILGSAADDQDEASAAAGLRTLAAYLRAGSTTTTTPTNGPAVGAGVGALRRLGCLGERSLKQGCTSARSMAGAKFVDVSPDGKNVYVSSIGTDASPLGSLDGGIAVFRRDPVTGKVAQLPGKAGCLSARLSACTSIPYSTGLSQLRVAPDGRFVYAALTDDRVIAILRRAPKTGALTWIGCAGEASGCVRTPLDLVEVKNIVISPDGRDLYASARGKLAFVWLRRDGRSGRLAWGGCYGSSVTPCTETPLGGPNGAAITPDGRFVVVADSSADAVRSYARAASGALTPAGCIAGPNGTIWVTGCAPGVGIAGPENVGIGADGRLWVGSSTQGALVQLALDRTGLPGMADVPGACTIDRATGKDRLGGALCLAQPGLGAAYGVAVPADGSGVYTASYQPGAVAGFGRQADGRMALLGACFGTGVPGCAATKGLKRSGGIALASDERHVYVAAPDSSALTVFARRLPATLPTGPAAVTRIRKGRPVKVLLSCPAGPAWCVGRVTAASLRVKGRKAIRLRTNTFRIAPGATASVRLGKKARVKGGTKVRLVLRVRVTEPWGGSARAKLTLPTRR